MSGKTRPPQFAKGLLIGLTIQEGVSGRIKSISGYDIEIILKHSVPKLLYRHVKEILVDNELALKVDKDGLNSIIEIISLFVKSNFKVYKLFQETIYPNYQLEYARNRNGIVTTRFCQILDNFMILAWGAQGDLKECEGFENLLMDTLNYIKISKQSSFSDQNYFKAFMSVILNYQNDKVNAFLLETCLSDNLWSDTYIKYFTTYIDRKNLKFRISELKLLKQLIARVSEREKYRIEVSTILPLYKRTDKTIVNNFDEFIRLNLTEKDNLLKYVYNDIEVKDKNKKLQAALMTSIKIEPKIEKIGEYYSISNRLFLKLLILKIRGKFQLSNSVEKEILAGSNIYSWLLYPSKFDYSSFNLTWLYAISYDVELLNYLKSFNNSQLSEIVEEELLKNYSNHLSKVFWKYLK